VVGLSKTVRIQTQSLPSWGSHSKKERHINHAQKCCQAVRWQNHKSSFSCLTFPVGGTLDKSSREDSRNLC
jgi:hypothetical protein